MSRTRASLLLAAFAVFGCQALFPHGDNPENCVLNPGICDTANGVICNAMTQLCQKAGDCSASAQCDSEAAAFCELGQCVPCSLDTQCITWSKDRRVSPARNFCYVPTGASGGTCGECKSNENCGSSVGGPFCDLTTLKCRGCLFHSECDSMPKAGDGVCKRPGDPSTIAGATGQCVPAGTIAYLGNMPAGCEASGANPSSVSKPYCTLAAAMASMTTLGKSVIKVLPSATTYPAINLANQTVTLVGPGRDASPGATFPSVVLTGSGTLTLSDVVVSASVGPAAIHCTGTGQLNVIASNVVNPGGNGIVSTTCASVTIERTRVNSPGSYAIEVNGPYRIVNSLVVESGGNGMHPVFFKSNAVGVFNYNTVARSSGSVICAQPVTISNSTFVQNRMPPESCNINTSVVDATGMLLGTGSEPKLQNNPLAAMLCIDRGEQPPANEVQTDYFGALRPKGGGWDKGYHELK